MLQLLGDFGGFNGSIQFLLGVPMSFYSASMYSRDVTSLFKERKKAKKQRRQGESQLVEKIEKIGISG